MTKSESEFVVSRFATTILGAAVVWLCIAAQVAAERVLPPEHGKHSFAFIVPETVAPFETGARVEFIVVPESSPPYRLRLDGIVLGVSGNVAFVELSERGIVRLMKAKQSQTVKVIKSADPDANLVAERRALAAEAVPVTVAPHMQTLTIRVPLDAETVRTWTRGDTLVFRDVREQGTFRAIDGRYISTRDVMALFNSATPAEDGQYDVEFISGPGDGREVLQAAAKGPVRVEKDGFLQPEKPSKRAKCFIRRRNQNEVTNIEIPCQND